MQTLCVFLCASRLIRTYQLCTWIIPILFLALRIVAVAVIFFLLFLNEGTEHKATIQCITMNALFYVCVNSNATRIVVHELDANHTEYQTHSFVLRSRCFHKLSSDLYECDGKNERATKFILKWSKQYFPCNGTLKPNSPVMQLYRVRKRNKQNSEKKRIYHKWIVRTLYIVFVSFVL